MDQQQAPVKLRVGFPKLFFKGREIEVVDIEFGKYTEDCYLLAANFVDTNTALTSDDLIDLSEEPDFEECWCSYLWNNFPDRCILAMDQ